MKLVIPFIESLEEMAPELMETVMEEKGAKAFINANNWPEEYPYTPSAVATVARSKTCLCIRYDVRGLDLRAEALEDHGKVWEDSCCEFFVAHPSDGTYYNFELNCIGTLLAAKRTGRNDPAYLPKEQMERIVRRSSLQRRKYDENGKVFSWSTVLIVPFDIFGVDTDNLPASLKANFYKCADMTSHMHFLSWSPITISSPDFHRPDFFGELVLHE